MPESRSKDPLVWIDCEMTGLDPENDTILQIACFITDHNLALLDSTGFEATIHHSKAALDSMNDWCIQHHGDSGLTQACLESTISAERAASNLLTYIKQHVPEPRVALLAGNTVHMDKEFLKKEPFSKVIEYLHYRILDVSSIKEAARRWVDVAALQNVPAKKKAHTSTEDILESIEEARYYRDAFFSNSTTQ